MIVREVGVALLALAAMVMFVTFWVLVLPAAAFVLGRWAAGMLGWL